MIEGNDKHSTLSANDSSDILILPHLSVSTSICFKETFVQNKYEYLSWHGTDCPPVVQCCRPVFVDWVCYSNYGLILFVAHKEYIDQFCKDFKSTLLTMIENGMSRRQDTDLTDPLHVECIQHIQFAQQRCQVFHGREGFLKELKQKVMKSR